MINKSLKDKIDNYVSLAKDAHDYVAKNIAKEPNWVIDECTWKSDMEYCAEYFYNLAIEDTRKSIEEIQSVICDGTGKLSPIGEGLVIALDIFNKEIAKLVN